MEIAVIGATGRIGSSVVTMLRERGHRVRAASPSTGVDTITRDGLAETLAGADVVVDVIDSPTTKEGPATWFFATSTTHLLAAEAAAGVAHHVGLSILGADRVRSGYFRARLAQEVRVEESGIPYTILRAAPVFEDIEAVTRSPGVSVLRLAQVSLQPVATADVAATLARLCVGAPVNGPVELAGPERFSLDELARRVLRSRHDDRPVVADPRVPYLGAVLDQGDRSLLPHLCRASTRFDEWLGALQDAGREYDGVRPEVAS
jgi:uncharacterized protein YbjT (DUF2867 family)